MKANLAQRAAEKTYGIPDAGLTPALSSSKVSFIDHMNAWKHGHAQARLKLANQRLARTKQGELEYKTRWYGTALIVADRWYPSSKTCSGCGGIQVRPAEVKGSR